MKLEELVQEANQKIKEWATSKDKLVVAIDGYTGVGKTTLLENLVKLNPDILLVHWDDFLMSDKEFEEKLKNEPWRAKICESSHTDHAKIFKLINIFRTSNKPYRTKIFNPHTKKSDTPT